MERASWGSRPGVGRAGSCGGSGEGPFPCLSWLSEPQIRDQGTDVSGAVTLLTTGLGSQSLDRTSAWIRLCLKSWPYHSQKPIKFLFCEISLS